MSDITLNRYLIYGTDADRLAYTPVPADLSVAGPGAYINVLWTVSDVPTHPTYAWDESVLDWVQTGAAADGSIPLLTADPASPADDTVWFKRTGSTPSIEISMNVRIAGATTSIPIATIP